MVNRELVEARVLGEQLQAEQKLARLKLASLQGFWNYFRRRRLFDAGGPPFSPWPRVRRPRCR